MNLFAPDQPLKAEYSKALAHNKEIQTPFETLAFFKQATEVAANTSTLRDPESWNAPCPHKPLSTLPPSKAMLKLVPSPPWDDFELEDWNTGDNPFVRWREAMRPVARALETALCEPVYHFADLGCDTAGDYVHRVSSSCTDATRTSQNQPLCAMC